MAIETEVKILITHPEDFRRRVAALKPVLRLARHFEDNYVLDYPDNRLKEQRCLIRVRRTDHGSHLTYKGPPRIDGRFKVREELETGVGEAPIVLEILQRLGLNVRFRYQKYREEFAVGEGHLALDETPVGTYAELEGSEAAICDLARSLGYNELQFIRDSYYTIYSKTCIAQGCEPTHMVFP